MITYVVNVEKVEKKTNKRGFSFFLLIFLSNPQMFLGYVPLRAALAFVVGSLDMLH